MFDLKHAEEYDKNQPMGHIENLTYLQHSRLLVNDCPQIP
jgi:hypothetical protein